MKVSHAGQAIAVTALCVATAACGSGATAGRPSPAAAVLRPATGGTANPRVRPAAQPSRPGHDPVAGDPGRSTVGPGCGRMPASGSGSIRWMASQSFATAAAHDPVLAALSKALRVAGLSQRLNSARAITVFAPDNAAFADLGAGNLQTLLATKPDLVKVLEYHVVPGRQTPADLAAGRPLRTLRGMTVRPSRSGRVYTVGNAAVVCGNIQTANATVYIVNKLLIPTS